jgi:hypothetical protein
MAALGIIHQQFRACPLVWSLVSQCSVRFTGVKSRDVNDDRKRRKETVENREIRVWTSSGGTENSDNWFSNHKRILNCEEYHLVGYKTPVRTSQETHYLSATESNQLMLCKIWGFQGGDYEECRLLGYKTLVRTSQETHYLSTTESSRLMLCTIWGFHDGDYEECRLLGHMNQIRTSQETHYISVKGYSQLILWKNWGFHDCDYEECRLLGYKNPVRTSQETQYVYATELSRLMLCKIWVSGPRSSPTGTQKIW